MSSIIPTTLDAATFAVRTASLTKRFGKHIALDAIDVTVPESAFFALVGPNGAGKTTLFKLLLELIPPTSGTLDVLGMNPLREGARVRAHIGYVPERSEDLYSWMNVKRALDFHRRYFPAWDEEYATQLMRTLHVKEGKLNRLSKGEVRRVQIVMALAHRPPVLLLDEPTDGLDPVGRDVFQSLLADHIATTPTTVVISTHLVNEVEALADHLAVLRNGKLVIQTRTDDLRRMLKRYVVVPSAGGPVSPPAGVTVLMNGSERERAWTLWGDEAALSAQFREAGAQLREVRPLTLQEATVAFLSKEDA